MLNRLNTLKRTKPMNDISPKMLLELKRQVPVRDALALRCGGRPYHYTVKLRCQGKLIPVEMVRCLGGTCEICGKPANGEILYPHEEPFKSHGGKVSLEQSKMAHWGCHLTKHGEKVIDSKPKLRWLK